MSVTLEKYNTNLFASFKNLFCLNSITFDVLLSLQVGQMESLLSLGILGVKFEKIHDFVVELFRRGLGPRDPVVDFPIVGRQIDEPVVQGKLSVSDEVISVFLPLKFGFASI